MSSPAVKLQFAHFEQFKIGVFPKPFGPVFFRAHLKESTKRKVFQVDSKFFAGFAPRERSQFTGEM
jgi:hypothetical protein